VEGNAVVSVTVGACASKYLHVIGMPRFRVPLLKLRRR
jgi:hypothetical protein